MKPDSLIELRYRMRLSRTGFSEVIGVHRHTLGRYEKGSQEIPRVVALACAALAFNLPPME